MSVAAGCRWTTAWGTCRAESLAPHSTRGVPWDLSHWPHTLPGVSRGTCGVVPATPLRATLFTQPVTGQATSRLRSTSTLGQLYMNPEPTYPAHLPPLLSRQGTLQKVEAVHSRQH